MFENGVAKTRVRVTPKVRVGVRARVRVRIVVGIPVFTIPTSWTWRGLKTIHLPFLRESVRCTVCSSPNVTYLKDCRHIFCNMRDCGRSTSA